MTGKIRPRAACTVVARPHDWLRRHKLGSNHRENCLPANYHLSATPKIRHGVWLLLEIVVPLQYHPHIGTQSIYSDMMVVTGAHERTEAEYCDLFSEAGMRPKRILATEPSLSVIEAAP